MGILKGGKAADISKIVARKTSFEFSKVNKGMIYLQNGSVIIGQQDSRGNFTGYMVSNIDLVQAIDALSPQQLLMTSTHPQGEADSDCLQSAT